MNLKTTPIADLTIDELRNLIQMTVKNAMTEVMIEMTISAEIEADISEQAEMTDFLRMTLQDRSISGIPNLYGDIRQDD